MGFLDFGSLAARFFRGQGKLQIKPSLKKKRPGIQDIFPKIFGTKSRFGIDVGFETNCDPLSAQERGTYGGCVRAHRAHYTMLGWSIPNEM